MAEPGHLRLKEGAAEGPFVNLRAGLRASILMKESTGISHWQLLWQSGCTPQPHHTIFSPRHARHKAELIMHHL